VGTFAIWLRFGYGLATVWLRFGYQAYVKYVPVKLSELLLDARHLLEHVVALAEQTHLAVAHLLDLVAEAIDLVEFALAAVLSGDLVLATAPDVADEGQLGLAQVVLAQAFIELVHRQVYNVAHGYGNIQSPGALLVPRQVLLALALATCPTKRPSRLSTIGHDRDLVVVSGVGWGGWVDLEWVMDEADARRMGTAGVERRCSTFITFLKPRRILTALWQNGLVGVGWVCPSCSILPFLSREIGR
jgi:spore maturation protein SpmB